MGLLIFFNAAGIPKSLLAVGIGHVVINLPLCFAIIYSQMGDHQMNIERAARDLGAPEWKVLLAGHACRCCGPPSSPRFFLSMTFSWDEFVIAFLLTRFDTTLPVEIWNLLRSGLNPQDQRRRLAGLRRLDRAGAAARTRASSGEAADDGSAGRDPQAFAPLRQPQALDDVSLDDRAGQLHGAARALRLRQDHAAVDPRRLRPSRARAAC